MGRLDGKVLLRHSSKPTNPHAEYWPPTNPLPSGAVELPGRYNDVSAVADPHRAGRGEGGGGGGRGRGSDKAASSVAKFGGSPCCLSPSLAGA